MSKFKSYDGVDKNGVRAEVMVQTGSGRIKELNPKGTQQPDGSYRNMEVVFDPDNPHLKRKVYAMLDVTAKDLWDKIQEAQKTQQTIEYRIESTRKRNVDRTIPFEDLVFTEQVIRILAAIDDVFSHEAKTDPAEDPSGEHPSALTQNRSHTNVPTVNSSATIVKLSANDINSILTAPWLTHVPTEVLNAFFGTLLSNSESLNVTEINDFTEKFYNTVSVYNSQSLKRAAEAERFALDYLRVVYDFPAFGGFEDKHLAQAAALADKFLNVSDQVLLNYAAISPDTVVPQAYRETPVYKQILSLVLDTITRRTNVPLDSTEKEQKEWEENLIEIASERLRMLTDMASAGSVSLKPAKKVVVESVPTVKVEKIVEVEKTVEPEKENLVETMLGGERMAVDVYPDFKTVQGDYVSPTPEIIGRLKNLCEEAGVLGKNKEISDWLEYHVGHRNAKQVNSDNLERFVAYYENEGSQKARKDILG